jgi:hypothetical protein
VGSQQQNLSQEQLEAGNGTGEELEAAKSSLAPGVQAGLEAGCREEAGREDAPESCDGKGKDGVIKSSAPSSMIFFSAVT